jgi:hypothetical protein
VSEIDGAPSGHHRGKRGSLLRNHCVEYGGALLGEFQYPLASISGVGMASDEALFLQVGQ